MSIKTAWLLVQMGKLTKKHAVMLEHQITLNDPKEEHEAAFC